MKKFFYFAFLALATMFASCEKIDIPEDENNNGDNNTPTENQLIGTWVMPAEYYTLTFNFTETGWSCVEGDNETHGTYTLDGDVLTMRIGDSVANQVRVIMLYGNNILVMRYRSEFGDGWGLADEFGLYFRENAPVNASISEIQGKWYWYFAGDETIIRASLEITDNQFDFIIPIWRERMKGTLEYTDGMIRFRVSEFYTRDNLEEGNEAEENLYVNWRTPDPDLWDNEDPSFGRDFTRPFVANGNVAYCVFANLPAYFVKQ